jgi:hypothetical protein
MIPLTWGSHTWQLLIGIQKAKGLSIISTKINKILNMKGK